MSVVGSSVAQRRIWRLTVLNILGLSLNSVRVMRIGGFVITPAHLLFASTVLLAVSSKSRPSAKLAMPIAATVFASTCHAGIAEFIASSDWIMSMMQFASYACGFLLLSGVELSRETLVEGTPWVLWLSAVAASASLAQFALWFGGANQFELTASHRYGGFAAATGLSTEPARLALSLAGLLALNATLLLEASRPSGRFWYLSWCPSGLLIVAIGVTFSITGIVIASCVLVLTLASHQLRGKRLLLFSIVVLTIGTLASMGILVPAKSRLAGLLAGRDRSANVRVVGAARLMTHQVRDFETFAFGTGLGMETRGWQSYQMVYAPMAPKGTLSSENIRIHSIPAVVRFYQGWTGFALYLILLLRIVRRARPISASLYPLLAYVLLWHFAHGWYLDPSHWSLLAILYLIGTAVNRSAASLASGSGLRHRTQGQSGVQGILAPSISRQVAGQEVRSEIRGLARCHSIQRRIVTGRCRAPAAAQQAARAATRVNAVG